MPITKVSTEKLVIARVAGKMSIVSMDVTTMTGSNPSLAEPICTALMSLGITPTNLVEASDADLAVIEPANYSLFLASVELRVLLNIKKNLTLVDVGLGPARESLGQLSSQLDADIAHQEKEIEKAYGSGNGTISAGVIGLDFQAREGDLSYLCGSE